MSDTQDGDVREECLLTCIALLIGGNTNAQENFYNYMVLEDTNNVFLIALETMLQQYFNLAKKYLTEKNAKLEMLMKLKKM